MGYRTWFGFPVIEDPAMSPDEIKVVDAYGALWLAVTMRGEETVDRYLKVKHPTTIDPRGPVGTTSEVRNGFRGRGLRLPSRAKRRQRTRWMMWRARVLPPSFYPPRESLDSRQSIPPIKEAELEATPPETPAEAPPAEETGSPNDLPQSDDNEVTQPSEDEKAGETKE